MLKRIFTVLIVISIMVAPVITLSAYAEETSYCVSFDVTSVNGERTAMSVVVYDSEKGGNTETSGVGVELAVDSNGLIIGIDKNKSDIPQNGYVVSFGAAKKNQLPKVTVGDYVFYDKDYNSVTIISKDYSPFSSVVIEYDAINAVRAADKLIVYRGSATTNTNTWGYEACVDANGNIVSVGGNNNAIPEGGYVISGVGVKKTLVEQSCFLGYSAVLNEADKTITIAYTKENAVNSYKLRYEELEAKRRHAIDTFQDVDNEGLENSSKRLSEIIAEMETVLSEDRVFEFLKLTYTFDSEAKKYKNALVPYAPVEARTLWLRIPTTNNIETVKRVVKEIDSFGFNSVCIELLFDSTTIMPMPEDSLFEQNPVFEGVDMLSLYLEEFHKYGIEVHAWMSCYRVGHDASANISRSVAKKKPEWLNMDQNGSTTVTNEYGNAYFLNPALDEVKSFLLDTYEYILKTYAIDGFQLDYVRYPENSTVNYGYDEYTKSKFLEEYKFSKVPTASGQQGWNEWCKFRASFVTDLVKSTGEMIREIRPDVIFSCDVAPDYATTLSKMCQDSVYWLENGLVDAIYPMAYGTTDAVAKWTNLTVESAGKKIFTVIGLRDNGAEIYREQIVKARECAADGSAFFSYSQYVAADYSLISQTVFAKKAENPSFNAKNAISAQLEHTAETINNKILSVDGLSERDKLVAYASKLIKLKNQLKDSDILTHKTEIEDVIREGNELSEFYSAGFENVAQYLENSSRIIEKTYLNSRDHLRDEFRPKNENENIEIVSGEESADENQNTDNGVSAFEKVFQVIFIAVMSIGVLGLPAYFYLESRKKRIAKESENPENRVDSETEE